jgi:hypothetical protein
MDPRFRPTFNAAYSDELYRDFLAAFEKRVMTKVPYRVAETPFFVPDTLRDRLASHAREVLALALSPDVVEEGKRAIPPALHAPQMGAMPDCVQVDFAIVENEDGSLDGRVVELQAFPSLYALMVLKLEVVSDLFAERIPDLARDWSIFFGGLDKETFVSRFRHAVLDGHDPEHVVLLDLDPEQQKTYPDFSATRLLLGVDAVCPTRLVKEGRRLFREKGGRRVPVERIYNRIVFDELTRAERKLPFSYTDDLDVTWCSHPNWYWIISKHTLPRIEHPAVPRARTLRQIGRELPEDLSRYVLKPLFSFAGSGVIVDVTRADIDAIPDEQRDGWLVQEKIAYHPGIPMPDGAGVKAEVRMMFLKTPADARPELALNLVRLSRGKMLGVDQNKNLTWVGGSIGLFDGPGA